MQRLEHNIDLEFPKFSPLIGSLFGLNFQLKSCFLLLYLRKAGVSEENIPEFNLVKIDEKEATTTSDCAAAQVIKKLLFGFNRHKPFGMHI